MRINDRINAQEVRLISSTGDQVGVVSKEKALELAKNEDLDLVEIVANQSPPVCRIMDFGKYKFEQSKKAHAAKKKQKQIQVKEIKFDLKVNGQRNFGIINYHNNEIYILLNTDQISFDNFKKVFFFKLKNFNCIFYLFCSHFKSSYKVLCFDVFSKNMRKSRVVFFCKH